MEMVSRGGRGYLEDSYIVTAPVEAVPESLLTFPLIPFYNTSMDILERRVMEEKRKRRRNIQSQEDRKRKRLDLKENREDVERTEVEQRSMKESSCLDQWRRVEDITVRFGDIKRPRMEETRREVRTIFANIFLNNVD